MKKPKHTEPITVKVKRRYFGHSWFAQFEKLSSNSAVSPENAVSNLALRYFFGGCTFKQGVTDAERKRIEVVPAGENLFEARLVQSGGGIQK